MRKSLLNNLAVAAVPLYLLISYCPPSFAAQSASTAKVFRPKNVKPRTKSATGVAIVNAASYLPGISPGGIASIFGVGLSGVTDVEGATMDPLPYQIADVTVFVNNVAAPLYTVAFANGEDQINFQVPYETPVGLVANGQGVAVDVYNTVGGSSVLVSSTFVDSYTEDPGIFIYVQNNVQYAIAVHYPDYSLITPEDPAVPGEVVILYTTALGPLTVNLQNGYGAPSDPIAYTQDQTFTVPIDSVDQCTVLFSGLAPGFVGLNQLNLQLPSNLPAGDLPIQILTTYTQSGIAYISVN